MNEMPFPLIVFARIIVGRPLVERASSNAERIAAMSWPSMTMACQPNALPARDVGVDVVVSTASAAF